MYIEKTASCQCIHPFHAGFISKLKNLIQCWQLQRVINKTIKTNGDSALVDSSLYVIEHLRGIQV